MPIVIMIKASGQTELLEVVRTLDPVRGLAHLLHGGQQKADQNGDDADYHKQFEQRESAARSRHTMRGHGYHSSDGSWVHDRFGPALNFDTSQTLTVRSRLPETRRRPSGLNDRLLTSPV